MIDLERICNAFFAACGLLVISMAFFNVTWKTGFMAGAGFYMMLLYLESWRQ